jgi:DNA-binding MarR family transcriptional regulator
MDPKDFSALKAVIDETTALYHRLTVVSEQIYGKREITAGKRSILKELASKGPLTVPQMANARPVSRQYMQNQVNLLTGEGYVECINNPAHKRSSLVRLTQAGKSLVDSMNIQEEKILALGQLNKLEKKDLEITATVLRELREFFVSNQWMLLIQMNLSKTEEIEPNTVSLSKIVSKR